MKFSVAVSIWEPEAEEVVVVVEGGGWPGVAGAVG